MGRFFGPLVRVLIPQIAAYADSFPGMGLKLIKEDLFHHLFMIYFTIFIEFGWGSMIRNMFGEESA